MGGVPTAIGPAHPHPATLPAGLVAKLKPGKAPAGSAQAAGELLFEQDLGALVRRLWG